MALTFLDKNGLEQLWNRIGSVYQTKLTIDSSLSSSSTNPVQNRVINNQITSITNSINSITGNVSTIQSQVTNINNTVNSLNTNAITGITVSGSGNVISGATKNGKVITFTKGNITASGPNTYTTGLTLANANASNTGVTLTGTIRLNDGSPVTGSTTVPFSMMQTYVDGRISSQTTSYITTSTADGRYVNVSGDTMTGQLTVKNRVVADLLSSTTQVYSTGNAEFGGNVAVGNAFMVSGNTTLKAITGTSTMNISGATQFGSYVRVSGNVSGAAFYENSDMRLKENVKDIEDVDRVKNVSFKQFNFKDDKEKTKRYGVIAQEVEKAGLSNCVGWDGKEESYKSVDYISLLCLAVEQLRKENEELKERIRKLENK